MKNHPGAQLEALRPFLLVGCLHASVSLAQTDAASSASPEAGGPPTEPRRRTAMSINPGAMLVGAFSMELEHAASDNTSFFAAPVFVVGSLTSEGLQATTSGFGADVGLRAFLQRTAPHGFWAGPKVGFAVTTSGAGTAQANATAVVLGAQVGYSWVLDSFHLSLGGGADYRIAQVTTGDTSAKVEGFAPSLRFALGFAL